MNQIKFLFCTCFLLIYFTCSAQTGGDRDVYARYKREIKNIKEDTDKVLVYLKFAKLIQQPDTALAIAQKADNLAAKLNYMKAFGLSHLLVAQKRYVKYITGTANLKDDTLKVLQYLLFSNFVVEVLPDTGLYFINKAKLLSGQLKYQRGVELSLFVGGGYYEVKKDYPLAVRYYQEAAKMAELHPGYLDANGRYPAIYSIYSACLNICYYQADYVNALDLAQKGLSLAEAQNNKEDQAHYLSQKGFIYLKQDKPNESIKYYTRYLTLANETHNRMMVADACSSIADDYLQKNEYKIALAYLFRAFSIYDKMADDTPHDTERLDRTRVVYKHNRMPYILYKIGTAYKQEGDYKQALYYSLTALHKADERQVASTKYDKASYYIDAGDIYRLLKDYRRAGPLLNKGLALSRSIRHREDMRDAYIVLSKNFAAQRIYDSAYYYQTLFTGLKDSIINEKVSREINALEVGRRDKEIALLNQQQKLKAAETAKQGLRRNFIMGFIALVAAISILLIYIRGRIRHQKLVFEKQLAVQTERQRISSDMHDDIGTGLSTLLIYVNMLKLKLAHTGEDANISRIAALGTGLVDQMKEIVWALSPGNDRLDSLLLFIRQYFVMLFEPLNYTTEIVFPSSIPDMELDGQLRRNVFLCVKESLNNVIKHANASHVVLTVQITDNILVIEVNDNGKGLLEEPAGNTTGNGLKNIGRRMSAIKGKSKIFNRNGAVVRLVLNLSMYPKE